MKISTSQIEKNPKQDVLITTVFEGEKILSSEIKQIDQALKGKITDLIQAKLIQGKPLELTVIYGFGSLQNQIVLVAGLGKRTKVSPQIIRDFAGDSVRKAKSLKAKSVAILLDDRLYQTIDPTILSQCLAEGAIMGTYQFKRYKTKDNSKSEINTLVIAESNSKRRYQISKGLEVGTVVGDAVNMARDLSNTPANDLTPQDFVDFAKSHFKPFNHIRIEVIDEKKAKSLGMGALIGVGQGSVYKPQILILKYHPKKTDKPIALVGKGVTFDTGGISIKPSKAMGEMKADMSGAAAVIGAMSAVASLKPDRNVWGIMPLAENMPSANAQRPGDVVTAMNGKTIEIINTDAEGRLILADALCWAVKEGAKEIIDLATLTGSCLVALGDVASAILGNNQKMIDKLMKITETTGERLWQLPLYEEFLDYLKSDVADIMNCTETRLAGTSSAAKFLEQFVDKTPWVHLDIASMMMFTKTKGCDVKGMSGTGVRNLVGYVLG